MQYHAAWLKSHASYSYWVISPLGHDQVETQLVDVTVMEEAAATVQGACKEEPVRSQTWERR